MGADNQRMDNGGDGRERREMGGREGAREGQRERERARGSRVERRRGPRRMSSEGEGGAGQL